MRRRCGVIVMMGIEMEGIGRWKTGEDEILGEISGNPEIRPKNCINDSIGENERIFLYFLFLVAESH